MTLRCNKGTGHGVLALYLWDGPDGLIRYNDSLGTIWIWDDDSIGVWGIGII